ncbi:HEL034Wp [Eremothecium sinecaudum]|uniref:HEL034Wp n=1 Tax=Eremothecium sinecaudum TaxID=45286 RepID=A0A0X8HTM9_9SACH|nr:HEL034Wp [Eremothecium sinecaudum]AMD21246.1 HEL034Wp [Eremothecium sinecaudum]
MSSNSNILSIINPPPPRDISNEEAGDCLPCQVMSTAFSLGFGAYLLSGRAFEYNAKDRAKGISPETFAKQNPKWWQYSVKGIGGSLIMLGLIRGTEGWLWNKSKVYKPVSFES